MERIKFNEVPQEMMNVLMAVEQYIQASSLSNHLVDLVKLRVSQVNHCAYCMDMHYKELKHKGESDLRLSLLSVWPETNLFDEKEKATLLFAEQLTKLGEAGVTDEAYENLSKHFDKEEICFLTLAVAQINTWTRMMRSFKFVPGNHKVAQYEGVA